MALELGGSTGTEGCRQKGQQGRGVEAGKGEMFGWWVGEGSGRTWWKARAVESWEAVLCSAFREQRGPAAAPAPAQPC